MTNETSRGMNGTQIELNADPKPTVLTNGMSKDASGIQDNHLEGDPHQQPSKTQLGNSKDALESYDWQELEDRFAAKMKECQKREEELGREFRQWIEVGASIFYRLFSLIRLPNGDKYPPWALNVACCGILET